MFPDNLARLQAEHAESNYRLAKALGIHQTTIANWRSGERRPHPKHLAALAEHYGCSVEKLVGGDEHAEKR